MTEYKIATEADFAAIVDFSNDVFSRRQTPQGTAEYDHSFFQNLLPKVYRDPSTAHWHRLAYEDGVLCGCVATFPLEYHVGAYVLRCAGIGTVGVSHAHRGRGYMKHLMKKSLCAAEEQGYDFALLGGLRQRYAHYGFELAGIDPVFSFTADNARYLFGRGANFGYAFRVITREDEALLDYAYAQNESAPQHIRRTREKLYDTLLSFESTPVAVFTAGGEYAGYFLMRQGGASLWELRPLECAHMLEILSDYIRQKELSEIQIYRVGAHETALLRALGAGCEDCALRRCDSIRIFRYETTLRAYLALRAATMPLPQGSVVLGFENGEVLRLSVLADGKSAVEKTDDAPLYTLSHADAVKLLFGPFALFSDCGYPLPAAPRAWFPLPFALNAADDI